jgi:CBS domain containing-hemolysin-like protein
MTVFSKIFKGFINILDWCTRQVLRLVGLEIAGAHSLIYSVEELKHILSESEEVGVIHAPEREMLDAIFDLSVLTVGKVMIPRTEIIAIEADTPLQDAIQVITQTTYTKLPVYEDNLDQILGILHVKNLLRAINTPEGQALTARALVREAIYVPETIPVNLLLHRFRVNRQHIAIVLDEYGGTAGLVTLEDLLEEIVGEVSDPFDPTSLQIQKMPDGSVLIDGLALIEEVNQKLGLDLYDPNYNTIAGYVLGKLGHIPQNGEQIESDGVKLRVEGMDGMRIARLSITRANEPV